MDGEKGNFNTLILGSANSLKSSSTILENQDFDKRNFSLSIWDHKDNFLCLLKPASGILEGQSYNENLTRNIYGEETLSFTIPAYINENKENEKWDYIFNEQKIRYIKYDNITNKPIQTKEFVLKHYEENRNGYEKVIQCECESLAVYELSKMGWNITFDVDYISQYEIENEPDDFLSLDYWLRKIFYKETNLGRVSTTTEYTYLLQGLQLRDNKGYPIEKEYSIDENGNYHFERINEPVCSSTTEILENHLNPNGWTWEVQAIDPRRLDEQVTTSTLYEEPTIDRYIEVSPNNYLPYSYQKYQVEYTEKVLDYHIVTVYDYEEDGTRIPHLISMPYYKNEIRTREEIALKPFPISEEDYDKYQYVTNIKKSLVTCERSNIFSVIQTLCETFKVWAYFNYNYNEQGEITERKIIFKTEAVDDNIVFDFSYGKNLQSCSRVIDSNELVTKLIIPDTESNLDSNRILSIKQSVQNPTGEGYIYNFDYFYNTGNLTKLTETEKIGNISVTSHSDEYYINYHCGKLKNINNNITNLQSYLVPLYQRQMELEGEISVQQASITALKDNIQAIQEKIDAIPENMQVISSWSDNINQQNYIGELKTLSATTDASGNSFLYLNFNREDIIYNQNIEYPKYRLDSNGEIISGTTISVSSYIPRFYTNSTWAAGTEVTDLDFTQLDLNKGIPIYSNIDDDNVKFIKGFLFNNDLNLGRSYIRVRYQYAPLIYYYYLIQDYWKKIDNTNKIISDLNTDLQEINNKIIVNESQLNNLLNEKNEMILQFEKKYAPFIKEGYWEPTDYQSQIAPEQLNTSSTSSIYEGITIIYKKLSDLKLNSSLHNYSYYIELSEDASDILTDTITMITLNPVGTGEIVVPRYQGHDFEIFKKKNENKYILGISPDLIDTYVKNNYDEEYYKGTIEYKTISSNIVEQNKLWINFTSENSPQIEENYIYISNDNILTDSLEVYDSTGENKLELYKDYTYSYDYTGYNSSGQRVPLDEQSSYDNNIYYDYILKITLKNTPINNSTSNYIVKYNTESTLTYLYNDVIGVSKDYSMPKITYSISMVDLSGLNEYKDYKPILGQKVPIFDPEMRLNGYEGVITSISKNLEHPEETQIELATYQTRFEDIFQKLTATMTDVKYNQNDIMAAANSFTPEGSIKANVFQKSLNENNYQIQLGVNNDITIDKTSGITLVDQDNNNAVKIIGNGIFLTEEFNGNDSQWVTGITGKGINANTLTSGNIDTKNINIWNSSEGQIRFIWNEQGLFAYGSKGVSGTSTSTVQDFVDYDKFVKFNYDGLQFSDNGRSALSLGWDGLNISAQNNSLHLDANNGLLLQEWSNGNATTRLELGKLDEGSIYGLRLKSKTGEVTLQNDSEGDLWLQRHIRLGGKMNSNNTVENSTAGIYGYDLSTSTEVPEEMQMGLRRNDAGDVVWDSTPIRFWAGPQEKENYKNNIHISNSDITSSSFSTSISTNLNKINDKSPTLAKFKVSANGDIIASGIDVGGWIGQGDKLHSADNEAILRSNGYDVSENNYPLIAIGKSDNNPDLSYGTDYAFRVYQDGTVVANKLQINMSAVNGLSTSIDNINNYINNVNTDINNYINSVSTDVNNYIDSVNTKVEKIVNLDNESGLAIVSTINTLGNNISNIANLTDTSLNIYKALYNSDGSSKILTQAQVTSIAAGAVDLSSIGGFTNTNSSTGGLTQQVGNYYVGLKTPQNNNNIVFYAGTSGAADENNAFWIKADGSVKASNITLTGNTNNNGYLINSGAFKVTQSGIVTASNMTLTGNTNNSGNLISAGTSFTVTQAGNVTANNITFNGTITANYNNINYTGINTDITSITINNRQYTYRVVRGLVVGAYTS